MKISKDLKSYLKQYRENKKVYNIYSLKVTDFNKRMKDVNEEDMTELELNEAEKLWKDYNKLMITYVELKKLKSKVLKGTKLKKKK